MQDLPAICRAFGIAGKVRLAERWGSGHINDSYSVLVAGKERTRRYLVQRINRRVFPDPVAVVTNIRRVTLHLRRLSDDPRRTLTVQTTPAGDPYHRDADGEYWRVYPFIEGTRTVNVVPDAAVAREGARAFGLFQRQLDDLPGPPLTEVLPGFHHTPTRFAEFLAARDADAAGRAGRAAAEIRFALAREEITGVLEKALAAGKMSRRVTHNDTKINNVLFDEATGEGICVIDLDTVMPGLALYDFGDLVRTSVSPAVEDERDVGRVEFRPEIYQALVEGYTGVMGDLLTEAEHELLFFSGKLITFELGLRFLADYLGGDTYFRTKRPEQNLDRVRVLFALVERLEAVEGGTL